MTPHRGSLVISRSTKVVRNKWALQQEKSRPEVHFIDTSKARKYTRAAFHLVYLCETKHVGPFAKMWPPCFMKSSVEDSWQSVGQPAAADSWPVQSVQGHATTLDTYQCVRTEAPNLITQGWGGNGMSDMYVLCHFIQHEKARKHSLHILIFCRKQNIMYVLFWLLWNDQAFFFFFFFFTLTYVYIISIVCTVVCLVCFYRMHYSVYAASVTAVKCVLLSLFRVFAHMCTLYILQ